MDVCRFRQETCSNLFLEFFPFLNHSFASVLHQVGDRDSASGEPRGCATTPLLPVYLQRAVQLPARILSFTARAGLCKLAFCFFFLFFLFFFFSFIAVYLVQ